MEQRQRRDESVVSGHAAPLIALSILGAANMAVIALRQLGIIAHLPDPPIRGFNADRVTTSPTAVLFGIPDAPVESLSLAANVPLLLFAGSTAGARYPWLPVFLGAKSAAEAAVALWYFEQMRTTIRAWCAYCLFGTTINLVLATMTGRVAARAARQTRPGASVAAIGVAAAAVLLWRVGRGRAASPGAPRGRLAVSAA